jgi:hypothetical protein
MAMRGGERPRRNRSPSPCIHPHICGRWSRQQLPRRFLWRSPLSSRAVTPPKRSRRPRWLPIRPTTTNKT